MKATVIGFFKKMFFHLIARWEWEDHLPSAGSS